MVPYRAHPLAHQVQIFFSLLSSVALSATAADENSGTNLDVLLTVLWRSMLHAPSPTARDAPGLAAQAPGCATVRTRDEPPRAQQEAAARP